MKASELINKRGDEEQLKWLRKNNDKDYKIKASVVIRLAKQVETIKYILDEITKGYNLK